MLSLLGRAACGQLRRGHHDSRLMRNICPVLKTPAYDHDLNHTALAPAEKHQTGKFGEPSTSTSRTSQRIRSAQLPQLRHGWQRQVQLTPVSQRAVPAWLALAYHQRVLGMPSPAAIGVLHLATATCASNLARAASPRCMLWSMSVSNVAAVSARAATTAAAASTPCKMLPKLKECLGLRTKEQLLEATQKSVRLLHSSHKPTLRDRRVALEGVLCLDRDAVQQVLHRCPRLLGMKPSKVRAGVEAVRDGLELGSWDNAVEVAVRCLSLLAVNPQRKREALHWLKSRLELSNLQLKNCMIVAGVSAPQLEHRLKALPEALNIPADEALHLAKLCPNILIIPTATIATAWRELTAAVPLHTKWRAQVRAYSVGTLVMMLGTKTQRLKDRLQQVKEAAPPPQQLLALSVLVALPEHRFNERMQRIRAGSSASKPGSGRRRKGATTVATALPSLAAQV